MNEEKIENHFDAIYYELRAYKKKQLDSFKECENACGAACRSRECAISAGALRLVGRTLRPPLVINIFCRGGRGEAAGRINEAQNVHPGLMRP
jgi:hypothetical protein